MTFAHAYAMEVAQASLALIVTLMVCWGLWDAWQDVRAQQVFGTRAHEILAYSHRQRQVWRLALALIVLYIGVWSVTHPPPPALGHFWDSDQLTVGRLLFMAATLSHGGASMADWLARRRIAQMFEDGKALAS